MICRASPLAEKLGLVRLVVSRVGRHRRTPPGFSESEAAVLRGLEAQPKAIVAPSGCGAWEKSASEARAAGTLGDVPLMVLTGGKPMSVGDTAADKEISAFHEIWVHQLQPKLAALSTRGKQVVVEDSGHGIATDRPDLVIEIIHQMVRDVRR